MAKLSLNEAAKLTGKGKATLSRALKNGKMSGEKNKDGSYSIDPAELFRVFPEQENETTSYRSGTPSGAPETGVEIRVLQAELNAKNKEIALLRATLDDIRKTLDDLRTDRDAWRQQTERQTLLLQDQRDEETAPKEKLWFRRLLGR